LTGGPKAIVPANYTTRTRRHSERLSGIGTKGKTAEVVGNQGGNHLNGGGVVVYNEYDERGATGLAALRPLRSRAPRGFVLVDEFRK